jgi:hypothetical protein
MSVFFNSILGKFSKRQEMPKPETEKVLEVNLGCFGGFDSAAVHKAWTTAYEKFLTHLKQTDPKKQKVVQDFWDRLNKNEVPETKSLFSGSVGNLGKIFEQVTTNPDGTSKSLRLISIGSEFDTPGEENYFLAEEFKKQLGSNFAPITVFDLLTTIKTQEEAQGPLDLSDWFMFDDFTDEELKKEIESDESPNRQKYKDSEIDYKWAKGVFDRINSLYPKELEKKAGRDFAKYFKQEKGSPLIQEPMYGDRLRTDHIVNLADKTEEVKVKYDGSSHEIPLKEKVLKLEDSDSGKGIFMYHPQAHTLPPEEAIDYFNEFTIRKITKGKKFTLENYVAGPKILIPYNLKDRSYGRMTEYVVDIRFGYYFDPSNPNEIKVISSYGRFNYPGKKSNIAQGGGVVEIKVVKDSEYRQTKLDMLSTIFDLSKKDGEYFQSQIDQELHDTKLQYNGAPLTTSPLPFIISETAFEKMKAAALQVAQNLNSKKPFMFALDAFLNPSP